ncbi:MAG: SMP-30/gluconolactonase/LRE family protein [Planctomycetota bacterium]
MRAVSADLALACACVLGEGPVWHEGYVCFVDIEGRAFLRFDPTTNECRTTRLPDRTGFAVPSAAGDWLVAQGSSLARFRPETGDLTRVLAVEPADGTTRLNDAKPDPTGRLFAGTMDLAATAGAGALYRVDSDRASCSRVVDDVTISNGLAWHEPTGTMYYIDTAAGGIDAFDWCAETGAIRSRRRVAAVEGGVPDGMAIDSEGLLWVAIWGGSRVARIDPATGQEVARIRIPCSNVTSCCFGGAGLDRLWITTARVGLSDAELAEQPQAGGLFVADVGVIGARVPKAH